MLAADADDAVLLQFVQKTLQRVFLYAEQFGHLLTRKRHGEAGGLLFFLLFMEIRAYFFAYGYRENAHLFGQVGDDV